MSSNALHFPSQEEFIGGKSTLSAPAYMKFHYLLLSLAGHDALTRKDSSTDNKRVEDVMLEQYTEWCQQFVTGHVQFEGIERPEGLTFEALMRPDRVISTKSDKPVTGDSLWRKFCDTRTYITNHANYYWEDPHVTGKNIHEIMNMCREHLWNIKEDQSATVKKSSRKVEYQKKVFDPNWYPKEWLVFLVCSFPAGENALSTFSVKPHRRSLLLARRNTAVAENTIQQQQQQHSGSSNNAAAVLNHDLDGTDFHHVTGFIDPPHSISQHLLGGVQQHEQHMNQNNHHQSLISIPLPVPTTMDKLVNGSNKPVNLHQASNKKLFDIHDPRTIEAIEERNAIAWYEVEFKRLEKLLERAEKEGSQEKISFYNQMLLLHLEKEVLVPTSNAIQKYK